MDRFDRALLYILFPVVLASSLASQKHQKHLHYVVSDGETLSSIAKINNISLETIMKENPDIENTNAIYKGQKLRIPSQESLPKAPKGYAYWGTVGAKLTGYDPSEVSCGKYANGLTSIKDNAYVFDGIAADPKAVPYRSKVYIDGIGFKEVDDTGRAMRESWRKGKYHFDIRFSTVKKANQFGVKKKKAHIFRKIPR